MKLLDNLYLNYYGLVVSTIFFQWMAGTFFLIALPNKSKSAQHLLAIGIISTIFSFGYILAHTFYYPTFVPRFMNFIVMGFGSVFQTQFILHLPELRHPRFAKYLFYLEFLIAILLAAYAIYLGFHSPEISYDFEAHYYEVNVVTFLKISGFVTLLIVFILIGICVLYAYTASGSKRKTYLLMLTAHIGISIIPVVLTLMNKSGFITREAFLSYYVPLATVGYFIQLLVFINNTTDRTSFLFKIVSIGFLTFLLLFNATASIVINERDTMYDLLHLDKLTSTIQSENRSEDLRYIISYDTKADTYRYTYKDMSDEIKEKDFKYELINVFFLENLKDKNVSSKELIEIIQNLRIGDKKYLLGYEESILQFLSQNFYLENAGSLAVNHILSKQGFIFYRYNKIKELGEKDFRKKLEDFLSEEKNDFAPFANAINAHLLASTREGNDLKEEVLLFLLKLRLPENRKYREGVADKESYLAFHYLDKKTGMIYEVGYSYREYRKFIHKLAIKLFYVLLIGMFIILLGTPIFLSGAIVSPLNDLLVGLRKVRNGDLTITLPVKVQDEIGFLATSFNMMVKSIRESKEKLEEYSLHLEQKVEERTNELKFSLNTVSKLKTQQDGDYFLTSILLKPFIINEVKSETVELEFLISQKKKFEFHEKEYEIGGDLCHTQNIILNGKTYILFFNSDAMGKSLQGAGGALVFGSVFFAIIERTNQSILMKDQSPERWLKNAFIELHKVFLTFDGSMLVSAVIGLVDETTGLFYYINAEHPWTACFRDGVCDFIERENYFSKLGSPINTGHVSVNLYQMRKGDMIFVGSDGRDDFRIKNSLEEPDSYNRINYDEKEFLKTIVEANGDLQNIYDITSDKGVITDDYSVIRILYKGENFEQWALKDWAIENYESKNFREALRYGLDYINQNPVDTEFLFLLSKIYKLENQLEKAAYYAERVRIRNPNKFTNLANLVQIQLGLGAIERAEEILKECESLDLASAKYLKLRELLQSKKEISADNGN